MEKFILSCLLIVSSLTISNSVVAQKGKNHHQKAHHPNHHNKKVVVYHSKHRPAVAVIYHPHWAPNRDFHRRWVYFPAHRLYWDNWRQLYFYHNGKAWISVNQLPPHLIHLKLENEKHQELEENLDEDDEIYEHQESIEKEK